MRLTDFVVRGERDAGRGCGVEALRADVPPERIESLLPDYRAERDRNIAARVEKLRSHQRQCGSDLNFFFYLNPNPFRDASHQKGKL